MISVLGSKKTALGPPGCTLVIKGSRVWPRNTFLSKTVFTKIQIHLFSQQHVQKNKDTNTKLSVKTMQRGCRKGARIICIFRIIAGNTIGLVGEKTFVNNFAYAWGLHLCPVFSLCICVLYLCSLFVVCQREKLYQRKLRERGQPGRDHSLVFCVNAWKCFGTTNDF